MKKVTVEIEGMACGMCESHINTAIREAFSVKKVTSSHSKGETVILSEESIEQEKLRKVIDQTGYQVKQVTIESYEKQGLFSRLRNKK